MAPRDRECSTAPGRAPALTVVVVLTPPGPRPVHHGSRRIVIGHGDPTPQGISTTCTSRRRRDVWRPSDRVIVGGRPTVTRHLALPVDPADPHRADAVAAAA